MTASTCAGTEPRSAVTEGASWVRMRPSTACADEPVKGGSPASIS